MKLLLLYTDPGSGAMLLQVLFAFLASGLFYFRTSVKSLLGIGGSLPAGDVDSSAAMSDEGEKRPDDVA